VLDEDSCRPWVRLERRSVVIVAQGEKNYRFEVHVPEDATDGLCRFAIVIEPTDPYLVNSEDGRVAMPILGRFAVLVYVTIGDAKPEITMHGLETTFVNGRRVPAVRLQNDGNTYDRSFGQVAATDASGVRFVLNASDFPILPGRSEAIALVPESPPTPGEDVALSFPLTLDGRIEIGGERLDVEGIVE
jgi:fimbrial chaperone protein